MKERKKGCVHHFDAEARGKSFILKRKKLKQNCVVVRFFVVCIHMKKRFRSIHTVEPSLSNQSMHEELPGMRSTEKETVQSTGVAFSAITILKLVSFDTSVISVVQTRIYISTQVARLHPRYMIQRCMFEALQVLIPIAKWQHQQMDNKFEITL
jgi:hypothetical protein